MTLDPRIAHRNSRASFAPDQLSFARANPGARAQIHPFIRRFGSQTTFRRVRSLLKALSDAEALKVLRDG